MSKFKISKQKAYMAIEKIIDNISSKYGIDIIDDSDYIIGTGSVSVGVDGNFEIRINKEMRTFRTNMIGKSVEPLDFLNQIRTLYHEEQHILQSFDKLYNANNEDSIQMAVKNLACFCNSDYYNGSNHRYNTNLAEIDAELTALVNTYDYLSKMFSEKDAEQLVCDMVNFKSEHADYFIKGHYDSFDKIAEAFSDQYEKAKFAQIEHMVIRLRPNQEIDLKNDEYIQYLQQIVMDNEENKWLMDMVWQEHDVYERDRMIASIVLHIHPEISYKDVYPCLENEDLSPETVFGKSIPSVPNITVYNNITKSWEQRPIGCELNEEDLNERIQKANTLHRMYSDNTCTYTSNQTRMEFLDESKLPHEEQICDKHFSTPDI